jgi:3-hydroxyethyl bacteriochlorophyllide a dehydrogenase
MSQPIRTRAIVFPEERRAALHENVLLPPMDDEGVLVRTEFSTISRGTELDLYSGQMHGRGAGRQWYPMLPGYMPVGIVEAVGSAVKHLAAGDRVVGSNLFEGFDPRYCAAWAGHTQQVVISRASHPGLAAGRAVKVPASIPASEAGLGMLAGVAWHGVREKVRPLPGEIVLVIGQGVIGNFAAQLCKVLGARVLVTDKHPNRLESARLNGLGETILTPEQGLKEAVLERTNGQAPDAVIEVSGENAPFREALDVVRRYGRVHAQGMYLQDTPPELLRTMFDKNLTISATVGETPTMTAECLQLMEDGKLTTHGMLTHVADPRDAADVYEALYCRPDLYITCGFQW